MSSVSNLVRSVRLDDENIAAILQRLDSYNAAQKSEKRDSERFPYRVKGCVVHVHPQMGSTPTSYLVPTRNISASGLAFLHGGFLYPGSSCDVQLISVRGEVESVEGVVIRCAYVEGMVHEIGVRFVDEVDPAKYSTEALQTRALLVEDDPAITRLATAMLEQLHVEVDHAENGEVAIKQAFGESYDVILMDIEMPVLNGFDAVKQLRERGYSGMIVAATGMTQPADKARCKEVGCDDYISKPFDRARLAELLESIREDPLISTLGQDKSMISMVEDFVDELGDKARAIEAAFEADDDRKLEYLCRTLKSEAGGYGFEPISKTASSLEQTVINDGPRETIRKQLKTLLNLCKRARARRCNRT